MIPKRIPPINAPGIEPIPPNTVAGVLLCSTYPSLTPYTGAMPGIKAFVAAVFGGIGSIPGAFIGGILLGIIEILSKAYISSQLADAHRLLLQVRNQSQM